MTIYIPLAVFWIVPLVAYLGAGIYLAALVGTPRLSAVIFTVTLWPVLLFILFRKMVT